MEKLAQDVLSDFFKCEVAHIGRSGDGGIDLLMLSGDKEYAVQVKRRLNSGHVEQVNPIREFLGVLKLRAKTRGMFITTGQDFTRGCYTEAQLAKDMELVSEFELYNRDRFMSLLKASDTKSNPWDKFL